MPGLIWSALEWTQFIRKVPCAAKLLAVVPGGNGMTAGASTPAHSANMLVLATLMLTTVEAAPLAAIKEAPPVSALLSDLEVSDLRLHDQHLHQCTTKAPPTSLYPPARPTTRRRAVID